MLNTQTEYCFGNSLLPRLFFAEMKHALEQEGEKDAALSCLKHYLFACETASKTSMVDASKCIQDLLLYSDRHHGTVFHLACIYADARLFHRLLTAFKVELPSTLKNDLLEQAPFYTEKIRTVLLSLNRKKPYAGRSLKERICIMGAMGPSGKTALMRGENAYTSPSRRLTRALRGPNNTVTTPKGSRLLPICHIRVMDEQAPQTPGIEIFTEPRKDIGLRATPFKARKPAPKGLPANRKKPLHFKINRTVLKQWEKPGRYRGQDRTMGGYSARHIADLAGFTTKKRAFHWCHLAGYSMGGPDGKKPRSKRARDFVGPQQPNNLVLGTREANAQMLIIEDVAKALIHQGIVPQLDIDVSVHFYKGLKDLHVADRLRYRLAHDGLGLTLDFDMLSCRKVRPEEIDYTVKTITGLFSAHQRKTQMQTQESLPDALRAPPMLFQNPVFEPSALSERAPWLLSEGAQKTQPLSRNLAMDCESLAELQSPTKRMCTRSSL